MTNYPFANQFSSFGANRTNGFNPMQRGITALPVPKGPTVPKSTFPTGNIPAFGSYGSGATAPSQQQTVTSKPDAPSGGGSSTPMTLFAAKGGTVQRFSSGGSVPSFDDGGSMDDSSDGQMSPMDMGGGDPSSGDYYVAGPDSTDTGDGQMSPMDMGGGDPSSSDDEESNDQFPEESDSGDGGNYYNNSNNWQMSPMDMGGGDPLSNALSTVYDVLDGGRQAVAGASSGDTPSSDGGLDSEPDSAPTSAQPPTQGYEGMRPSTNIEDSRPQGQIGQSDMPVGKQLGVQPGAQNTTGTDLGTINIGPPGGGTTGLGRQPYPYNGAMGGSPIALPGIPSTRQPLQSEPWGFQGDSQFMRRGGTVRGI